MRTFTALCLVFLLALCADAQVTWRRTYGGLGSDEANCVRQLTDGGYIVAGSTGSFGAGGDMYLLRLDPSGSLLWSGNYGGNGTEQGVACGELADGYIVAGTTSSGIHGGYDMLMVRTDAMGQMVWERSYGTADWDLCNAMIALADGYLLGGISYGTGQASGCAYLVRTDLDGDTLWTRSFPGAYRTECTGLAATMDGGYIMVGTTGTASGLDDAFIQQVDTDGNPGWYRPIEGDSTDILTSVLVTGSGGIVAAGATNSATQSLQILLLGTDELGQVQWRREIGNAADAMASEVRPAHNGGYVLTGYNTLNLGARDMILTVTDADGWFQFGFNYGNGQPADGYSVDTTEDGGYVVAGWAENYGPGPRAMYVVKTDAIGQTGSLTVSPFLDPLPVPAMVIPIDRNIYPVPAIIGEDLHLTDQLPPDAIISFMDATGRLAYTGLRPGNERSSIRTPEVLRPGIYLIEVRSKGIRVASYRVQLLE